MIDIRQTQEYSKYLKGIGWIVERRHDTNYFIKKFGILGSFIKIQRPETINSKDINTLITKYRPFQIIIEPKNTLQKKYLVSTGYKLSNKPYLPSKTLHLILTATKGSLFKGLKKDCRQTLAKIGNPKITNYDLNNLKEFRLIWLMAVGTKRHVPSTVQIKRLKKSFGKKSFFIADENKESGAIFLIGDKVAYYWQAFSSKKGRRVKAQYQVVWEGILWAKRQGAKVLDFEGIFDPRFPDKKWRGFTHFKKCFGGEEKEYPGCYSKMRIPV